MKVEITLSMDTGEDPQAVEKIIWLLDHVDTGENPPLLGPPLTPPPAPGTASSPPPAPGVTVDATGLPWDGRIHSSNKKMKQDGTWRAKRGVAATVVAQVESELRNATPPAGPVPAAPPAGPAAPPAGPAVTGAPTATFPQVMQLLTALGDSLKMSEVLTTCGLNNVFELSNRPDLFDMVVAECQRVAAK